MEFTAIQWIWLGVAAFAVGIDKMGLAGAVMLIVPVVAAVFGGKESTGLLLPLLMIGDVFAVIYYKHNVQFSDLRRLLLWVCIGIGIGLFAGKYINDGQFKMLLSISVILCLAAMIYAEMKGKQFTVPNKMVFYALVGILGGFTSMVGNAAGPIMSIYLLSRGYAKKSYISTYVWLFMIINLIKLPLQIFVWHNIGLSNLYTALILAPMILAGAFAGAVIVKRINEALFRKVIYGLTLIAAISLWVFR
jgi:uncharacterized protein